MRKQMMAKSQSFHHEVMLSAFTIFLAPNLREEALREKCFTHPCTVLSPYPTDFQAFCFTNIVQGYFGIITTIILSAQGEHPNVSFK